MSTTPGLFGPSFATRLHADSLGVPEYRYLWSANIAWNIARSMEQIVAGWVAFELTQSAFLVALLGFYRMVPLFLLGMFGGVLGDRYDRKIVVLVLQTTNVVCVGVVASLAFAGSLTFTHLLVAELILGTSMAFDWPSRRALTVDLVERKHLANAVALDASGMNVSKAVGPILAGAMLASFSYGAVFATLGLVFLVNGLLILGVRDRPIAKSIVRTQNVLRSLAAGVGYVLKDEAIVGVLVITVVMNAFLFPYLQVLPVVAVDVLGVGSLGLGVLSAADGLGSLVGTLLIGAFIGSRWNGQLFWIGSFLGSLALLGFALTHSFEVAVGLMLAGGLARAGFSAFQSTIMLRNSSDEMRGRTMGVLTLAIGVGPFGSLEVGALAESSGPGVALAINAIVCSVLVVAAAARFRGLRRA
jgi:MFS family permease